MKYFIPLLCLLIAAVAQAQPAAQEAIDNTQATLSERYATMKSKSQTYEDYKVIKEFILDGFWKITTDSILITRASLQKAQADISSLQAEVTSLQSALKQKEASMEEIVMASTHVSAAGINFEKSVFKAVVTLIILGLLLALGVMTGKLNMMYSAVKEKMDTINLTSSEFEEFKKKAMERQTRLSRELQTERNRLMELTRS